MSFEEPYRVVDIERCTATILELWLRPLAAALEYLPGEYVLLEDRQHEAPPRSYSIANAPRSDGLISLLVTRMPDGQTSKWVHERLRIDDEVSVSGPYGTFVDDPRRVHKVDSAAIGLVSRHHRVFAPHRVPARSSTQPALSASCPRA